MIGGEAGVPIKRQCELLGINRSTAYYKPAGKSMAQAAFEERVMARIDYWHTKQPAMGSRKLAGLVRVQDGLAAGRKLVRRLMREMGIIAVYPKPNLSLGNKQHPKHPYLLRDKPVFLPNQAWAVDITYIKMGRSHMYLTAIIDWHSRYIVGWRLSETLGAAPVLEALKEAAGRHGQPGIVNSDQGSQFTSDEYVSCLSGLKIRQSMDGRARWVDNVVIERWFRSLKCECVYVKDFDSPRALRAGLREYIQFYNDMRPHQGLSGQTPAAVYHAAFAGRAAA